MKNILIITYYWPPSGGSGVQRWLKFTKYLPQFGWQPIVYTPENPDIPVIDQSLEKDISKETIVIKRKIWEPYLLYKFFSGKKTGLPAGYITNASKKGFFNKLAVWIRGNFFIPDPRIFWIKPSVKYLTTYIKANNIAAIISSGPPHSMHLIAYHIKKKFNIPWIADFRDPWTNIDFYKDLKLTIWADQRHKKLEKKVLLTANRVITIGSTMKEEFLTLGAKDVSVIYNGFDNKDFENLSVALDHKFTIVHSGTLNFSRNPTILWEVLNEIANEHLTFKNDLEIKIVGNCDQKVLDNISEKKLNTQTKLIEYLEHNEIININKSAQVLLLLVNNTPNAKGIITGKVFEYLASGRPILAIGPEDGDLSILLSETNSGKIIGFKNRKKLKETILSYYTSYKSSSLKENDINLISKYSRKEQTKKLEEVIEETILKKGNTDQETC